jgi:pilus assembly protein CpaB
MWKVKRMKPARIVILLIALVAGGIAALLASRSDQPPPVAPVAQMETVDVLVAAADIGLGTTVAGPELRWQTWPAAVASPTFVRKSDRPDAIQQLAGSIARAPSTAGEPIRETKLIKAKGSGYMAAILPKGKRAIAIDITPDTSAAGFILPNDHVDIILARRDAKETDKAAGADPHTGEIILSNIRVLAIDQTVEDKNGQRVVVGKTATLELSPHQSEMLARAKLMGVLTLSLRSIVDFDGASDDDGSNTEARQSINIVRFGVSATTSK